MKLYFSPGACSLSPHIVSREAGLPVELSRVTFNGAERTTAEGEDFFEVNPRGGYVPALRLDDGSVLVEGPAIIHYLADQAPDKNLLPERGSNAYYDALSWIAFVSTELHKGFSPLFRADLPDAEREAIVAKLHKRFAVIEKAYEGKDYLLGDFNVADAYAYTILRWAPGRMGMDLAAYPNLAAFAKRMEAREGVKQALGEEGLEPIA
jgi:glutathione S-transferase